MSLKQIELEFGDDVLSLRVPESTDILSLSASSPLPAPAESIRHSLLNPIGTPSLPDITKQKKRQQLRPKAVIVVSDTTRPVPYVGKEGILEPILEILRNEGVQRIEILVGTGTHRPLSEGELRQFLPKSVFDSSVVATNHVCTDKSSLRHIGCTVRGTEVWINTHYLDADIKILTGLVEPHFIAGVSGGRKSICPGIVGETVTRIFHGAPMMANERSDSLIMEGNPCHEEALEVARMAGADFIVNVTIDRERHLTGVYAGDLEQAHVTAVAKVVETNAIPIRQEYDLVITHAGFAGINHYQTAKACVEAVKAVKAGGKLIVAANNTDCDPIGNEDYKRVLPLLKKYGDKGFTKKILSSDWTFINEQWEVQMWARALKKLKMEEHLVYCSPQATGSVFKKHKLSGADGGKEIHGLSGRKLAEAMVQGALERYCASHPTASLAVLLDGPYGVPVLRP